MIRQSFFEPDTDTLLRFPQHLTPDTTPISPTIESSEFEYLTATPASKARLRYDDTDETYLDANCVCLNLETLKCFEVVEHQYEQLGVTFNNCIAIQPSNPAFPKHSGSVVLMGAPKGGFLEVAFARPVKAVKALVTSSQRLLLSAYNRSGKLVAQAVLPVGNLANSDSVLAPNELLSVKANQICSITFCAFDGQFTVDNFSYCC